MLFLCTQAMRDKEDAVAKLDNARGITAAARSSIEGMSSIDALELKYSQLKEEYKQYRKKAMAALQTGGGFEPQSNNSQGTPRHHAGS